MLSIFIFRLSTTTDLHYGNTGYGVSSPGMQNYKDFCQKINIPKRNYLILRIGEAVGVKRCQKSSESFSIFSFKNTKRTKIGLAKMVLIFLSYFCVLLGVTWCWLKSLLWAGATTRELAANFLLSNCADAHTQHNKKFD